MPTMTPEPADRDIGIVVSCLETYYRALTIAREKCRFPLWFRGHRDGVEWKLLPKVYRPPLVRPDTEETRAQEHDIAMRFKAGASIRREGCPEEDDHFGWLALMRHYNAPCRLLDWTESPLVALYFALSGKPEVLGNPPAVWAMDPYRFNEEQMGLCHPVSPDRAQDWAVQPFRARFGEHHPITVVPKENNLRMMVQASVFTMHGSKTPLDHYVKHPGILYKISIDNSACGDLLTRLEALGINRAQLFPELEYLSAELEIRALAAEDQEENGSTVDSAE